MKYRPDIDGLRGIAVLGVVLFHARLGFLTGGYAGVDIFFVISGYLITSIILGELEAGNFTLAKFYERRIRRILPALVAIVCLTWLAAILFYMPPEFRDFSQTVAATPLFAANLALWHQTAYFGTPAEIRPLLHLWSLAVEEQFYLLFPVTLLVLHRFWRAGKFTIVWLTLLVSLGLSIWLTNRYPAAAFYLPVTRAWELMAGAIIAFDIVPPPHRQHTAELVGLAGVLLIAFSLLFYSSETHFPGYAAIMPCLGAALLIHSGKDRRTIASRALSVRPVVFVGLISYSLYLIHWPIFAIVRYYWILPLSPAMTAAIILASGLGAFLSWKFVELPFRRRGGAIALRPLLMGAAVASLCLVLAGTVGYVSNGIPSRYPGYAHLDYRNRLPEYKVGSCFFLESQTISQWNLNRCTLTPGPGPLTLLWGDSFAAHYAPGLEAEGASIQGRIVQFAAASCAPILDQESSWRGRCSELAKDAMDIVERYKIERVILSLDWSQESNYYGNFYAGIRRTIEDLRKKGVEVVVLGQSPAFMFWDSLDVEYRLGITHRSTSNFYPFLAFAPGFNAALRKELPDVKFIDPMAALCRPDLCRITSGHQSLYIDGGHYSVLGSDQAVRAIADRLNGAWTKPDL